MTFEEVAAELKARPIITEYLEPAKQGTFKCLACNSGSGKKGTGATLSENDTCLHCWACGKTFTNIDAIAHHLGIETTGKDFCEVVKFGAEYFGLPLDDHGYKRRARNFSPRPQKKEPTMTATTTPTPKEDKTPVKFEEDQLDKSRANIAKIVEAGGGALKWRGLTMDAINSLRWGFEPHFHYHNNPTSSAAPAVIIPNFLGGVLARSVEGYFFGDRNKDHFAPMAPTTVYLPDSADFILFVTEGAINAASAWQAFKSLERDDIPALGFVATGGTPFRQQFVDWLLEKYPNTNARPRIAVAYDDDIKVDGRNPGQQAAKELISALIGEGFVTANIILEGKAGKDLNDVLQSDGDAALGNMIVDAVAGTSDAFQACAKKIERRKVIPAWEKDNGKIEPAELEHLEADVEYLQGLTVDKITADVVGTSRTLRAVAYCRYYDFYLDVANDFMARVEKAKAAAKELVKQAEPENPVDDSVQATATIATSKLSDKADKFVAEIGKAHKEYGRQQELKARAESESKREAARAKNNEEANALTAAKELTTRKIFADCPVDVHIPYGFRLDENGLYVTDGVNEEFVSLPVVVTKNLISASGVGCVEIAARDLYSGKWKRRIVEKIITADSRRILELANYDIGVTSATGKYLSQYITSQLFSPENIQRIPTQRIFERTGWVDDTFTEFIYPSDDNVVYNGSKFDYGEAFAAKGDFDAWRQVCLKVIRTSTAARLIVGAALVAPLLGPLGISNQWLHTAGVSGRGKTAGNFFAASIYGAPRQIAQSMNGTSNALESVGVLFYDLPNILVEMQTTSRAARENFDRDVYTFGEGRGRLRCNKDGALQTPRKFRGVRISDGEQGLTNEHSGAGAIKRAVEFHADFVFDNDFAVEIYHFVKEHYGLAGKKWIDAIKAHIPQIKYFHECLTEQLQRDYPAAYPNHIQFVAAIYTAGVVFEACVLGANQSDSIFYRVLFNNDGREEKSDAQIVFDALPKRDATTNAARALQAIADFYTQYETNFLDFDDDTDDVSSGKDKPYPRVVYGIKTRYGEIAFVPSVLKDEALKKFPNAAAVVRELGKAGCFVTGNDSEKHHFQKAFKIDSKTRWLYVFKKNVLFPDAPSNEPTNGANDDWLKDDDEKATLNIAETSSNGGDNTETYETANGDSDSDDGCDCSPELWDTMCREDWEYRQQQERDQKRRRRK